MIFRFHLLQNVNANRILLNVVCVISVEEVAHCGIVAHRALPGL